MLLGPLKSLTRMSAFVGKEFVEVARRPSVLLSLVLGPFLIMALFGLGYNGQRRPLNTVLVLPDQANLPRDLEFYRQYLGPAINLTEITGDAQAARDRLMRRQLDLVVVAPADVEQRFRAGQQSVIGVEYNQIDPVRDNYARFVADRQVAELNRAIIERGVAEGKQQYSLYNPADQSLANIPPAVVAAPTRPELKNLAPIDPAVIIYFAPAVLALILQHLAITLTALSVVRERLSGAMEVFRVAPVRTLEIVIGKYLAYGFFNMVIATLVTLLMIGPLKIPLLGDPVRFIGIVALLTFASLGVGLFISSVVSSERQAVQLSMLVLLASVFFGGLVLPLDEFQGFVQYAASALPVTHGIQLLQDMMLYGNTFEAWRIGALAGIGLVFFLLTTLALKRSLARA